MGHDSSPFRSHLLQFFPLLLFLSRVVNFKNIVVVFSENLLLWSLVWNNGLGINCRVTFKVFIDLRRHSGMPLTLLIHLRTVCLVVLLLLACHPPVDTFTHRFAALEEDGEEPEEPVCPENLVEVLLFAQVIGRGEGLPLLLYRVDCRFVAKGEAKVKPEEHGDDHAHEAIEHQHEQHGRDLQGFRVGPRSVQEWLVVLQVRQKILLGDSLPREKTL